MSVTFTSYPVSQQMVSPNEQRRQILEVRISHLVEKIRESAMSPYIPDIAKEIAEYAYEKNQKLDNWFFSLNAIEKIPRQFLPLSPEIIRLLDRSCPALICSETKPDGNSYRIGEKCTLTLVPEELGSVQKLENVVKAFGAKPSINYTKISFHSFPLNTPYREIPFKATHWQLQTDAVLVGSTDKTGKEQLTMLDALSKETSVNWETPELQGSAAATFLEATITPKCTEFDDPRSTRLKEGGGYLTISGSTVAPNVFGVFVLKDKDEKHELTGMKALLKL